MPDCRSCGAAVIVAETRDGERIQLDRNSQEHEGPDRWVPVKTGPPMVVEKLDDRSTREGYVAHRRDCPAFGDAGHGRP